MENLYMDAQFDIVFVNLNAIDWKNKIIIDGNWVCIESTGESGDVVGDAYLWSVYMPSHNDPIWMQKFSPWKSWASPTVYLSKSDRSEGDILTFTRLKTKRSSLHNNSLRDYNNFIRSNGQIDYSRSFVAHFRF